MGKREESANVIFFKRMCDLDGQIESIEMKIKELRDQASEFEDNGDVFRYNLTMSKANRLYSDKKEIKSLKDLNQALYYKTGGWQ